MPYLLVREKDRENVVELAEKPVSVGRSSINTIMLTDTESSRRQCTIRKVKGGYQIEDVGSRNGTWVNGEAITQHPLRRGDLIEIGQAKIFFLTDILPETLASARVVETRRLRLSASDSQEASSTMVFTASGKRPAAKAAKGPVFSAAWTAEEFQDLLLDLGPERLRKIQAWNPGELGPALASNRFYWTYGGTREKRVPVTLPTRIEAKLRAAQKSALVFVHVDELRVTAEAQGTLENFDPKPLFHEAYRVALYTFDLIPDLQTACVLVHTFCGLVKNHPTLAPILSLAAGRAQIQTLDRSAFDPMRLAEIFDVRFEKLSSVKPHVNW